MDRRDDYGLLAFARRSARNLGRLFPFFNLNMLLFVAVAAVWVFYLKPIVFPSKAEAFQNTKSAAEKGDVTAQFNLEWRYANGDGVLQDYVEAAKWYRKAAEQDHTDAQSSLGWMYGSGHGVPQNYDEAFRWYSRASERGDAFAQNNLGTMYQNGHAVTKDTVQAYVWYSLAAAQGNTNAVNNRDNLIRWLSPDQISEGQRRAAAFVPTK